MVSQDTEKGAVSQRGSQETVGPWNSSKDNSARRKEDAPLSNAAGKIWGGDGSLIGVGPPPKKKEMKKWR